MRQNQSSGSRRLSGTWSIASTSSWASNNEDAALPTSRRWSSRFFSYSRRGRKSSTSSTSSRTCGGMTTEDTRELWRCMLALQQLYGCYKSTRMDLAVNAGDAGINLMPNPFIIDTLNDSLVNLPAEGWEMLDRCLRNSKSAPRAMRSKPKSQRKFWSRS
ncbi:uncharacterized protein UV8b_00551 [Ustilaginoidea virens]|uniref:Uncharacterized protein n=1 Tax=Ustilaginoidea virens TaxID=1159556 RepID=A0A8E5HIZ6_USTVR|nr:uncharacterized protein UV8b_00551 [Ustilaginoidea virens]QUC16310.1 hypothetical protein UV8b_00551 [Ustilaginoidea virens]